MLNFFYRALNSKKGFTLIEVLVVVAIIGILAAVAAPNILSRIEASRIGSDEALARTLSDAIHAYMLADDMGGGDGSAPDDLSEVITGDFLDRSTLNFVEANINDEDKVITGRVLTITYALDGNGFTLTLTNPNDEDYEKVLGVE